MIFTKMQNNRHATLTEKIKFQNRRERQIRYPLHTNTHKGSHSLAWYRHLNEKWQFILVLSGTDRNEL